MKIVLGTDTYPPTVNGAARFTERYAHALAAHGHEVHVVCPSPTGPGSDTMDGAVHLHTIRSVGYAPYEGFRLCLPGPAARRTRQLVDELRPDIIHVQDHFLIGRGLFNAGAAHDIPLVATNHLMAANFFDHVPVPAPLRRLGAKWLWADVAKVFSMAEVITSPTPRAVELLVEATGFDHAIAVSNGIDIATYQEAARACRRAPGLHADVPTVLFVGRLDSEKRVGDLIDAFARLPESLPARLEIVGTGSLRERLEQQAAPLGDRVTFRGFVEDADLLEAYGRADIFCMPGVAELQSLVTLEAMAAGKPIVAADAMALPHLCHNGQNGYLFEPGSVDDLAAKLHLLLGDAALRDRMGAASTKIVAPHAAESTLQQMVAIYQDLTGLDELPAAA